MRTGIFNRGLYCDYRQICGHEARDGFRSIRKTTLEDIAAACAAGEEEDQ